MSYCYILFSKKLNKFYTGFTQNSVVDRLEKHNSNAYGKHFTSIANDWEIFLSIKCDTNSQAVKIEKHIKAMKSTTYIKNLSKYPEIIEKLLLKYKDT